MNIVHLLGRFVETPELKFTGASEPKAYCRFRIAVNRGKDKTDFFNIVTWEKTAKFAEKYFEKGDRIIIHGEIRNADWVDKNEVKHYGIEIWANKLEFVETKASKENPEAPPPPKKNSEATAPELEPDSDDYSDLPF